MCYERILVTLDGSCLSETALVHVTRFAKAGAQIHLLSVLSLDPVHELAGIDNPSFAWADSRWRTSQDLFLPNEVYARDEYLRQVSYPLTELGYEVTTEILKGSVVENIVSVARDDFDVIVMATHGRTGFTKLVMGSVAEAVLRQAPCPVLLIPARVNSQAW